MTTHPAPDAQEPQSSSQTAYVEPETIDREPRLAHLPVTFFAVVMGAGGVALAWLRADTVLGAPAWIGTALFWFALVLEATVIVGYSAKAIRHPNAVRTELNHPIRLAFVPTATISLLVLATAGQEIAEPLARALWWVGAVGQLALTLYVLTAWISRPTFGTKHVNPAWFIPVVGLVVVPLAGVRFAPVDISWFFFAGGVLFWLAMLPMVLTRLFVSEHPLPNQLLPTLAVLIAPPSVAFLSWTKLGGDELSAPGRVTYYVAVFFALIFAAQVGRLHRIPFFLSWWAYLFPLAALSVATTVMAAAVGGIAFTIAAWVLLGAVTLLLLYLLVPTALSIARGRICVPE